MKKIISLGIGLVISGCQLTAPQQQLVQTQEPVSEEQPKLLEPSCFEQQAFGLEISCGEEKESGVLTVSHPQEVPEIELLPEEETPAPGEANIWLHIRDGLAFPIPDNKRIANQRRWYLKHPDYMARVNKRATPFLYLVVQELQAADMPMELALLPIVESAFDPFAYSHGRAAGMWQFIPGTGKRFGMKQNWWYDGRRDVMASTRGAIAYMKYLNKMFDGDWLHALAAYNSGEGRVLKAIKKNKRKGKPTDFWSLDLPKETRAYVPKLLALSDILQNAEQYAFAWPELPNEALTAAVDIGSQIDLAFAAELAGLTLEELHALNPGFNRWATDPKGPHRLLVPAANADKFQQALTETSEDKRLNWVRHRVKSGDSLLKLAKKYHTSVDVIRSMNSIKRNMIRAGDHLLIPVALKSLDAYSLSAEQRLLATQTKKRGAYQLTHKVVSGDTLWDISRKYKVNHRSLAKWNGMAPTDPLKPGKSLVVWVNQVSEEQQANSVMRTVTYTVRNGDSLARIANRFKVSINDIEKWNQLNRRKYLQPGQKLKLFIDVTRT